MPVSTVTVVGAGPAGASAAIAALRAGASVNLLEKSHFPRHKVCGEFLSPEIARVLAEQLGVWSDFQQCEPAIIRRMSLYFSKSEKHCRLTEPGFGLSRYRFDQLLFERAIQAGANVTAAQTNKPLVIAHGRRTALPRGGRLFGFKAHYTGPIHDGVELFFFNRCYVGINCVEDGVTNVCGLGPEEVLKEFDFDIDALVNSFAPLTDRLRPLSRKFAWLHVGPLQFANKLSEAPEPGCYPTGDALSFVDPFTGSGLLSAVTTGSLAGSYAARGISSTDYLTACARVIESPFRVSSLLRAAVRSGWAERLVPFVPGALLVKWTRPHVAATW